MAKRKRQPKRRYSDEEKANALAALAANAGNIERTARELSIPASTLQHWANGNVHAQVTNLRDQKKGVLAEGLEDVAWRLLEGVTPAKIAETDVRELLTAVGIAVDKMQLLRGKPTAIGKHDFSGVSDDELDKLIATEERAIVGGDPGEAPPSGGAAGAGADEEGGK